MRGRKPSGPAVVERLPGSPQARERLRVVLETVAGTCRIGEACARLHVSEQRFDQLRAQVLQAGLDSLEPRPLGRPARPVPAAGVVALQTRIAELETELAAARVREEIALILPAVQTTPGAPEKKPSGGGRRRRRAARPRVDRRPEDGERPEADGPG
jgi:hypothetical protein